MSRKITTLLGVSIIAALFACSDKPTESGPERPPDDVIMPLKIGHWWGGTYTYINPNDHLDTIRQDLNRYLTHTVSHDNVIWYGPVSSGMSECMVTYFTNRSDGLWKLDMAFGEKRAYPYAKYPVNEGDTFYSGPYEEQVVVESVDTLPIRIPECIDCPTIIYTYHRLVPGMIDGPDYYYYCSPGFGEIKWEVIDPFHYGVYFSWEMTSFHPDLLFTGNHD